MKYLSITNTISKKAIPCVALFLLLAAGRCIGQTWAGTDDFSSGISVTNWIVQMSNGYMTVAGTNGHVSFLVPISTGADQSAFVGWHGTPTAAEDWAVSITGHNSVPGSSIGGSQLQLAVLDKKSWDTGVVYAFRVSMNNRLSGSVFNTAWWDAGSYPPTRASVGSTSTLFSLCLAYHAASQTIEAWYDPTASGLGWAKLDSMTLSELSPGMTATNTFAFAILGNAPYAPISEGGIWADNFRLASSAPFPIAVTTVALPNGTSGVAYNQALAASGGQTPYRWTNSSGTLPPGLTLTTNGVISGTPTASGTNYFTMKVTDATNGTATQALSLTISLSSSQPPGINGTSLSGTNLVLSGINGLAGATYYVLMSTNLTLPLSQWPRVATNVLSANGNFTLTVTNTVTLGIRQRFYRLQLQNATNAPTGMALIPAGSFTMGDTLDGDSDALPLHTNYVSAFYMDTNLVSYALWQQVYNWALTNGYSFDNVGSGKASTHPVQTIDWYDAVKWCNARSEKEGRVPAYYTDAGFSVPYRTGEVDVQTNWVSWASGYRLPTEAEWEKAARGGASGQRFPWGNTISESQANYYSTGTSYYSYDLSDTGYNPTFATGDNPYTSPVGYFAANGYGLYDMAGNVCQWCWDWSGSYSSGSQTDPRGPASGSGRVLRGGGWGYSAYGCRAAYRGSSSPTYSLYDYGLGLRLVLPAGQCAQATEERSGPEQSRRASGAREA